MTEYDVYGLGNALVDLEYRVTLADLEALGIEPGVMTLVDGDQQAELIRRLPSAPVHRSAGGSAANTVIALTQLGGRGYYSCKVARDDLGELYTTDMQTNGVATNADAHAEAGDTGRCLVMVTPDAERTMCSYLGITGDLDSAVIDEAALRASANLYIEGYLASSPVARASVARAREIAQNHGVPTALSLSDPNIVHYFGDALWEMIGSGVSMLFANEAEALGLTGTQTLDEAVAALAPWAERFVITRGGEGALVFDRGETTHIAAVPTTPLDSTGAGDMFAGAFLYGLSQHWSAAAAGRLAAAATARLITHYGPRLDTATLQGVLAECAAAATAV